VCRSAPEQKGKYIKIILALLQSPSAAVVYECAAALVALSQAPTAIRAAANCYCQLLVSQSDNNVKLIVLDRLQELKDKHKDVMQEQVGGAGSSSSSSGCSSSNGCNRSRSSVSSSGCSSVRVSSRQHCSATTGSSGGSSQACCKLVGRRLPTAAVHSPTTGGGNAASH
jgi:hypothetical protein